MLLKDGSANTKAFHPIQWRHLLERAGDRQIFIRYNRVGGAKHWGHAILKSIKNDSTLIVQPDCGHKRLEEVELENTHLWMSKTINNSGGGIPMDDLNQILKEGEQMVISQLNERTTEVKETDIVVIDLGFARYYAGRPVAKRYVFTEKATEAFQFKRFNDASRTATILNRNEHVMRQISETGLFAMTMKQAWALMKVARERHKQESAPPLRKLCDVPERVPNAIPEFYAAAFPPEETNGVPINQPLLSNDEKRRLKNNGKHLQNEQPNGHPESDINNNRISELFEAHTRKPAFQLDPSLYNAATVPVAIQEADAEVETAMRDIIEAQTMVNDAVNRLQTARMKYALLCLQIQPQIMAMALKEQTMASMGEMQAKILALLEGANKESVTAQ